MRQTACAPWLVRSAAAPGREPHLPIEQPTRLGLILNLKTAEALGGAGRTRSNEKSVSQTIGINSKSADDPCLDRHTAEAAAVKHFRLDEGQRRRLVVWAEQS